MDENLPSRWRGEQHGGERKMTREALEAHIAKIMDTLHTLPESRRTAIMQAVEETRKRHEKISESVQGAMDALDDWRLIQKYRVFDAEATAREQNGGSAQA